MSQPVAPRRRPRPRTVLAVVCAVALLPLTAMTATHWVDSPDPYVVAVASVRWPVGFAAVAVLLLSLPTRGVICAAAAALVAVHGALAAPAMLGDSGQVRPGSPTLTVLSANVLYGKGDLGDVADAARTSDADVVVLLEAGTSMPTKVDATELAADYPYRVGRGRDDAGGSLVLSRLPLQEVDVAPTVFDQPLVQVVTASGPVAVRAVHSASPLMPQWRDELGWLRDDSAGRAGPLVLAGDFNASVDHPAFRRLLAGARLRDAHEATGAGWVRTWDTSSVAAHVQIDHVLSRELPVLDAGRALVSGSDHAAVWARLDLSALVAGSDRTGAEATN